ncbi:MAG: hypothetical protein GYA24_01415, partial [Candidatus Lokiarchaeota archaeon]|nr:hypothetical protein [Candidatus Lokiarchaeota archaeon]
MRESYKYAVQTPFISFVKIEETFKTEFAINALKVWELFDTISGFHYCPVITYFAEEELLRFIRKLVILPGTDFDVGTAPRYR